MNTKLKITAWQLLIALLPLAYLMFIWTKLPETVPLHYDMNNQPNRMGSKSELLFVIFLLATISFGCALLLRNLHAIDPKQRMKDNNVLMLKMSWVISVFMSLIACFVIYQTLSFTKDPASGFSGKGLMLLVCVLFAVVGNFMNNVKPNYFMGIRTPWALENEDNWRKTHHLASKLWFFGGMVLAILIFALPGRLSDYILMVGLSPLVLIPFVYSYLLFKREKR